MSRKGLVVEKGAHARKELEKESSNVCVSVDNSHVCISGLICIFFVL